MVLLGGYSQCTLGDLPRSLAVCPMTAESWPEPEDRVGTLVLQLERALTSSPSGMAGRAYARHPGSIPVHVHAMLTISQLMGGVHNRRCESQLMVTPMTPWFHV